MKILYVEDELEHFELAERALEDAFQDRFDLYHVDSIRGALKMLELDMGIDVILCDLRLPDGTGLDLLEKIKDFQPTPAVVLVTGQGDQKMAVTALKSGAADYLVKEGDYLHRLPVAISNAFAQNQLVREQAALHASEKRFRVLVEQLPAAVYTDGFDEHSSLLYVSPQIEDISGFTVQEWMADPEFWINHVHPDDQSAVKKEVDTTFTSLADFNMDYRFMHRTGRIVWIRDFAKLVYDVEGNPKYWQGLLFDITKSIEAQEAIQASEERFKRIFHSSPIATCVVTLEEGRFIDANNAFVNLIGVKLEDLLNHTVQEFNLWERPEDRQNLVNQLKERRSLQGIKIKYSHVPGGPKDTLAYYESIVLDGVKCILAMFYDVTEQLKTQQALERQVTEQTALHAMAKAESEILFEDEIIGSVTKALHLVFEEVCGILLLDGTGKILTPHPSYLGADVSSWQEGYPITDGITGRCVSTGTVIRIGDVTHEVGYIEIASEIKSELCMPIRVHDRIIGVINIESKSLNAFTEHDENFLLTVSNGLGNALERLRLFDAEQKRTHELSTLYQATRSLAESLEPAMIGEKLIAILDDLFDFESISVHLYSEQKLTLTALAIKQKTEDPKRYTVSKDDLIAHERPLGVGIIDWVVKNGLSVRSGNVRDDDRYLEVIKEVRSELCVPLIVRGKVIGALNLESLMVNAYSEADERLITALANSAAINLENARLFELESKRREEAETLRQAASLVSSTLELDAVVDKLLSTLKQVISYDSGTVFFHEGDFLRIAMAHGYPHAHQLINLTFPADDELFQIMRTTHRPIIIDDVRTDPRFKNWGETSHIRSWMSIPLISRGKLLGSLSLESQQPSAFNETISETALAFAHQAAAAIYNAQLYDETQRRLRELEIINRISNSLRQVQSASQMIPILLEEALLIANTLDGSIWLYDQTKNLLTKQIAKGAERNAPTKVLRPGDGIPGYVFNSGEKYTTTDLKNDLLLPPEDKESMPPNLSGIYIPIKSTNISIGVLMVAIDTKRRITEEINLLTILADMTSNAIHRAELFDQSQEQIRRLTTLREIDSAIASSTDLRVTLSILMNHTLTHLKADAIDIMSYYPELQSLTFLTSAGFRDPDPSRPLMRLGEGLSGNVVLKGDLLHIEDLRRMEEITVDSTLVNENFVTYFGLPLIVKGQIKGVFEIFLRSLFNPTADWFHFMHTLAGQAAIALDNAQLFDNLQRSNQEIRQAYDTTLEGWARALELRDSETEGHTRRVTQLTMKLAQFMGITGDELINIYRGVLLHDIGKMGVSDQILRKTGPLSDNEWSEMRKHPQYAFNLLLPIPYLRPSLDIPYCHHEHWDGSGYPRGLKGEQIPLSARIFSIVDIWDALLSDRIYRKAWPRNKVIEYLRQISGTILDPYVVESFMKMLEEEKDK